MATKDSVKTVLQSVVHLPIDIKSPEGEKYKGTYYVRNTYPVFVLTDSNGDAINQWTGYSGADQFVRIFKMAVADLTTVKDRYARVQSQPKQEDMIFLARYNEEIGQYIDAVKMYRFAEMSAKKPAPDYSFNIYQDIANAVWNNQAPFSKLTAEADDLLKKKTNDPVTVAKAVNLMGNVARKVGQTSSLSRYLKTGIDITAGRNDKRSMEWHNSFIEDFSLYGEKDTSKAIQLKKDDLGPGWESSPSRFYEFARWCLERKIDLPEAEIYAKKAVEKSEGDKFKARNLSTLADIYEAQGKIKNAVDAMTQASQLDPENSTYGEDLDRLSKVKSGK